MKAEVSKAVPLPPPFTPVELKLVFETPDELEAFYAIMNHTTVVESVGFNEQSNLICDELESLGAINYIKKYDLLRKAIKDN